MYIEVKGADDLVPERSPSPSPEPLKVGSPAPKKLEIARFNEKTMEVVGELKGNEETVCCKKVVNELDEQGLVIISNSYRTHHYQLSPLKNDKKVYLE